MSKKHPSFAAEYRQQMVELVRGGRTPTELAREFECSAGAIRNWVRQADRDEGLREDGLTTVEREELRRLRRENRQLREEREILKIERRAFQAEARMAVFQFIEGWYNTRRRHSALGYLSPNDFESAVAAAAERPKSDGGPNGEADLEVSLIRESDVHDDPPRLPNPSEMEKALLPAAIAHLSAGAHSPQLSTESG